MAISTEFQKRLQDLIDEEETKRSELHRKMGVDYRSLANALNYGIVPKPRTVAKFADYFNVSIPYLIGETDINDFEKASPQSSFSERFRSLCSEREESHYHVSQECHFDKSYISRWLNKNQLPSFEILDILCDYFDVSVDYLLGRTDNR